LRKLRGRRRVDRIWHVFLLWSGAFAYLNSGALLIAHRRAILRIALEATCGHQAHGPPVSAYLPPKPRSFRLVAVLGYSKPNCDDYDVACRINNAHRRESADPNWYRAPKGRRSRRDRRPAGTEV